MFGTNVFQCMAIKNINFLLSAWKIVLVHQTKCPVGLFESLPYLFLQPLNNKFSQGSGGNRLCPDPHNEFLIVYM